MVTSINKLVIVFLISPVAVAAPLYAAAQSRQTYSPLEEQFPVLEEVVVTAQRRPENLMDVPLAVTTLSGMELEKLGFLDLTYLSQITPNTTIEVARGTNNALAAYIRGVGQQDHIAGFESGVGLYVDDVYFNRPQAALLEIYEVDRIEVLRGPQGTLYGRNTVGGAIKYVTRRLGKEAELKLLGRVGTYSLWDAVVTMSAPLADTFRVGGSVATFNRDGFGENIYRKGVENYNKNVNAARLSMEWTPAQDWFVRLSSDWLEDKSDLRRGHRLFPGAYSGAPVLKNIFNTRAGSAVPSEDADAKGLSLLIEWTTSDRIIFRGIFATRTDETWKPVDLDSLPTVDVDPATWDRNKQKTAELQAVFSSGRWNGVAGLFALDASASTRVEVQLDATGAVIGIPGLNNLLHTRVDTDSWAFFADLSYAVSDHWSLSFGGRYTSDERSSHVLRQILMNGLSAFYGGTGSVVRTDSDFYGSANFSKFTPRAVIQWLPDENQNIYLSYSEGFKGGGFDPRGLTTIAPDFDGDGQVSAAEVYSFMKFNPELVNSWELGWKTVVSGGRMTSRFAIFTSDYSDVQIPGSVSVDANGDGVVEQYVGITSNAASANISGLEWEGQAIAGVDVGLPESQLVLNWSLGILKTGFNQFIDELGNDVAKERVFANAPKWNAAMGVQYGFPVGWFGTNGKLEVFSTVALRGFEYQFETADPLIDQKSFALWDLSLVWVANSGRWQLGLYGKNLSNKVYKVTGMNVDLGRENNVVAFYGNPRQFWLAAEYRFQ